MVHIWHEDSNNSAFTQFLNFLKYFNVDKLLINAEIRGFDGNRNLCIHVENYKYNKFDKYILFFDTVWDNNSVLRYSERIDNICKKYNNIIKIDLLSFEYLILKFKYIINWTNPMKDTKIYNMAQLAREDFIECTENNIDWRKKDSIVNFIIRRKNIKNTNDVYSILGSLSAENVCTDRLGKCWISNCCFKFTKGVGNKKCRIFKYNKTSEEKAKNLWNCTDIHKYIK